MAYEIRERDIGGVLDDAILLFRDQWKFLALISILALFPIYLGIGMISTAMAPGEPTQPVEPTVPNILQMMFGSGELWMLGAFLALLVVLFVVRCYVEGAVLHYLAYKYLGRPVTAGASLRVGFQRLPYLLLGNFIIGIAVTAGTILCVIPGLIAQVMFFLFAPALVLENTGIDALSRSTRLISGFAWQTFVLLLALGVMGFFIGIVSEIIPISIVAQSLNGIVLGLFEVFKYVVALVLYFSARCRVENLDLDLLVNAVDTPVATESRL